MDRNSCAGGGSGIDEEPSEESSDGAQQALLPRPDGDDPNGDDDAEVPERAAVVAANTATSTRRMGRSSSGGGNSHNNSKPAAKQRDASAKPKGGNNDAAAAEDDDGEDSAEGTATAARSRRGGGDVKDESTNRGGEHENDESENEQVVVDDDVPAATIVKRDMSSSSAAKRKKAARRRSLTLTTTGTVKKPTMTTTTKRSSDSVSGGGGLDGGSCDEDDDDNEPLENLKSLSSKTKETSKFKAAARISKKSTKRHARGGDGSDSNNEDDGLSESERGAGNNSGRGDDTFVPKKGTAGQQRRSTRWKKQQRRAGRFIRGDAEEEEEESSEDDTGGSHQSRRSARERPLVVVPTAGSKEKESRAVKKKKSKKTPVVQVNTTSTAGPRRSSLRRSSMSSTTDVETNDRDSDNRESAVAKDNDDDNPADQDDIDDPRRKSRKRSKAPPSQQQQQQQRADTPTEGDNVDPEKEDVTSDTRRSKSRKRSKTPPPFQQQQRASARQRKQKTDTASEDNNQVVGEAITGSADIPITDRSEEISEHKKNRNINSEEEVSKPAGIGGGQTMIADARKAQGFSAAAVAAADKDTAVVTNRVGVTTAHDPAVGARFNDLASSNVRQGIAVAETTNQGAAVMLMECTEDKVDLECTEDESAFDYPMPVGAATYTMEATVARKSKENDDAMEVDEGLVVVQDVIRGPSEFPVKRSVSEVLTLNVVSEDAIVATEEVAPTDSPQEQITGNQKIAQVANDTTATVEQDSPSIDSSEKPEKQGTSCSQSNQVVQEQETPTDSEKQGESSKVAMEATTATKPNMPLKSLERQSDGDNKMNEVNAGENVQLDVAVDRIIEPAETETPSEESDTTSAPEKESIVATNSVDQEAIPLSDLKSIPNAGQGDQADVRLVDLQDATKDGAGISILNLSKGDPANTSSLTEHGGKCLEEEAAAGEALLGVGESNDASLQTPTPSPDRVDEQQDVLDKSVANESGDPLESELPDTKAELISKGSSIVNLDSGVSKFIARATEAEEPIANIEQNQGVVGTTEVEEPIKSIEQNQGVVEIVVGDIVMAEPVESDLDTDYLKAVAKVTISTAKEVRVDDTSTDTPNKESVAEKGTASCPPVIEASECSSIVGAKPDESHGDKTKPDITEPSSTLDDSRRSALDNVESEMEASSEREILPWDEANRPMLGVVESGPDSSTIMSTTEPISHSLLLDEESLGTKDSALPASTAREEAETSTNELLLIKGTSVDPTRRSESVHVLGEKESPHESEGIHMTDDLSPEAPITDSPSEDAKRSAEILIDRSFENQDVSTNQFGTLESSAKNDDVELTRKRPPETWSAAHKRQRAIPGPVVTVEVVQKTRVNLERIKLMLFSVGSKVHQSLGYERLFGEYWNVLSLRLEGRLSESERVKGQKVLNSFLRTKALRKLHNQLILGLLERCVEPTAPLRDISHVIPSQLRCRITALPKPSPVHSVTSELELSRSTDIADLQLRENRNAEAAESSYYPAILESDSKQEGRLELPDGLSMRIPGAMIIDPHVRKLAESTGMKASENAVWLIVVAVKEYTKSLLETTLSTVKAVEAGLVPPRLSNKPLILPKKRTLLERDDSSKVKQAISQPHRSKCITALDLHTVTANLQTSARSLSGCVSRVIFERSLYSSFDSSLVAGSSAFDEVKKFIVSAVSPPPRKRTKVGSPAPAPARGRGPTTTLKQSAENAQFQGSTTTTKQSQSLALGAGSTTTTMHPTEEAFKGQKSSPARGLGRGAKDLAALKVRAASITAKSSSDITSAVSAVSKGVVTGPSTNNLGKPGTAAISLLTQSASAAWIRAGNPLAQKPDAFNPPVQNPDEEMLTEQNPAGIKLSEQIPAVVMPSELNSAPIKPSEHTPVVAKPSVPDPGERNSTETSEFTTTMSAVQQRRGKGHGVKNLAAMKARSVTSSSDPATAADIAAAAAASSAAELSETDEPPQQQIITAEAPTTATTSEPSHELAPSSPTNAEAPEKEV